MALPKNRNEFKFFCLKQLGYPTIEINLTNEQIEDAIDYALSYYHDYHFDGTEKVYLAHKITAEDISKKSFAVEDDIIGIVNVLKTNDQLRSSNFFDIRYQMALNDFFNISYTRVAPYWITMQYINSISDILNPYPNFRYNRHTNEIHLDINWHRDVVEGGYVILEAYKLTDPDAYVDVWKDRWLIRYTVAHIKKIWGETMKKFTGVQLMGGITLNGEQIYNEAITEIKDLETEMISAYSLPPMDVIA